MNTSPHENEYLAAVAAMPEHTISPVVVHGLAVGDRISYRLRDWGNSSWSAGRVIGDAGPDRVWVNDEITNRPQAVDVRPWPAGEVLPF